METTLVLLKPGCVQRQLIGEVINRFERRGLRISGMKMMQLSDEILREHYAHLVEKPFFPGLQASMQASPVIAMALTGVEAVKVVRQMAGPTNGREAAPGTIRGDYSSTTQHTLSATSMVRVNANNTMKKIGLLPRIIIAIILGVLTGNVLPEMWVRVFVTFNYVFSQFLGFLIPLIIIELECQGAYTTLKPHEQLSWTVRWHLLPFKGNAEPSAKLMKAIKKYLH